MATASIWLPFDARLTVYHTKKVTVTHQWPLPLPCPAAPRAVKCTTNKVSHAVPLIYGYIHSLPVRPIQGVLQENMYVVRFRHLVLRQQKYNMRQWVASTALLSFVSCAPFNFATFTVPDTAGCESILACRSLLAEVRWTWTLLSGIVGGKLEVTYGNAVLSPPFLQSGVPRPQTEFFHVGMNVPRPER